MAGTVAYVAIAIGLLRQYQPPALAVPILAQAAFSRNAKSTQVACKMFCCYLSLRATPPNP